MTIERDSLNRLASRPTDKRYTFALRDGTTVTAWADSIHAARQTIEDEHPWVAAHDIDHLLWYGTTAPAGNIDSIEPTT